MIFEAVFGVRAAGAVLGEDGHPADEVAVMGDTGLVKVNLLLKQRLIAGVDEIYLAVVVRFFDAVVVGVVHKDRIARLGDFFRHVEGFVRHGAAAADGASDVAVGVVGVGGVIYPTGGAQDAGDGVGTHAVGADAPASASRLVSGIATFTVASCFCPT